MISDIRARIEQRGTEDGLFRLALEIEADLALDPVARQQRLDAIGQAVDARRLGLGLGPAPTVDELAAHWDGPPPAPIDEVRADLPAGATADAGIHVETLAGRRRVVPVVTVVEADGSTTALLPSPVRQRPRRPPPPRSPAHAAKRGRAVDLGFLGVPKVSIGHGPYRGLKWGTPEREAALAALGAQVALDGAVGDDDAPQLVPEYARWCREHHEEPEGPFAG